MLTSVEIIAGVVAIALIIAIGILIYIAKRPSIAQSRMTILSLFAAFAVGIATSFGAPELISLIKAAVGSDTVSIDPIRVQVTPGKDFTISGKASKAADHELWIVVYRASGGFDIDNRRAIPVATDGTWTFSAVVIGRPAAEGQKSLDSGATYNVAAVIVNKEGAQALMQRVSITDPNGDTFVDKQNPDDLVTSYTIPVTLP